MRNEQNGLCGFNNRLYKIWHAMIDRCNNQMHAGYHRYGGRGISVDPRWMRFSEFVDWAMKHGYSDERTIDRKDNDAGYSPENCRWADKKTQARNRSNNVFYEYNGEHKTIPEWAEIYGIKVITLVCRIVRMGWPMERALNEKVKEKDSMITAIGKTQRLSQWANESGLSKDLIYLRLKRGMNADIAVTKIPKR